MSTNTLSSFPFRLVTTRFPLFLFNKKPPTFLITRFTEFSFKPITFQKLPTKPHTSSSSSSSSPSTSLQPLEELPPNLQEIIKLFQSVQEPKAKYEQLLFYGKNLKPLDTQFKTKENKVEGCVSQVWVRAYLDHDNNVVYEADSDSLLTKGLAALLVQGFSGRPVHEVIRISPDFAVLLGLQQSLTPSRNNGFLNMLKLMQKKALLLYVETQKSDSDSEFKNPSLVSSSVSKADSFIENSSDSLETQSLSSEVDDKDVELGGRGKRIKEKLEKELDPVELEIEDVSYQHAGHAGVRGSNGETHFNLKVVSKEFEGKTLVKRHRLIYNLLQEELQSGLHALSIVAKTPSEAEEWVNNLSNSAG